MDPLILRPAIAADAGKIVRLIRALAAAGERRSPMIAPVTEASVIADGFGAAPCFEAILAVRGEVGSGVGCSGKWPGGRSPSGPNASNCRSRPTIRRVRSMPASDSRS